MDSYREAHIWYSVSLVVDANTYRLSILLSFLAFGTEDNNIHSPETRLEARSDPWPLLQIKDMHPVRTNRLVLQPVLEDTIHPVYP